MGNVLEVQWPDGRVGLPVNWTSVLLAALGLLWLVSFADMTAGAFYQRLVLLRDARSDGGSPAPLWSVILIMGAGLLVLVFGILHFAKTLYRQIFPGPLRIIAVAIVNTRDTPVGRMYEFIGAGKSRTWGLLGWLFGLLGLIIPLFFLLARLTGVRRPRPKSARARLKKNAPPLLYLDQARQLAFAAQTARSGVVVLLDEDLTQLRLASQQDRQLLLMSLRSVQAAVAKNPARLQAIIAAIEERELANPSDKKRRAWGFGPVAADVRGR